MNLQKYKSLFKKKINPYLHSHNGEAEVIAVQDGNLIIKMKGACSGCLSLSSTVDEFITSIVKKEFPEIKKVLVSDEPDPELWAVAKQILNHEI